MSRRADPARAGGTHGRRRADAALVEAGLFPSREQARAAVLAGRVRIGGEPVSKAGQAVADDAVFEVEATQEYVSRGGHKLAGALDVFGIEVAGTSALDVGASTGGFTDCLLQRGAAHVTSLDVGYGQLAWALRQDERVTVVERTNIRKVTEPLAGAPFGVVVIDVSFISLVKVLPHVTDMLAPGGEVVALVKPQFEAGKERVGKKGVVRDPSVHAAVLGEVIAGVEGLGYGVLGLAWSPIKGPEGNIEFWLRLAQGATSVHVDPAAVVSAAHDDLGG